MELARGAVCLPDGSAPKLFASLSLPDLFPSLIDRLGRRLKGTLPGHEAHIEMAPRLSARKDALSVEERTCREAGVLILLLPALDDPAIILTVRHDELPDHGGQIAFPGGQREGTESLSATALRESNEEIGLSTSSVRVLGALTPLYIPPSNYCVHPFMGATTQSLDLRPTDREVRKILTVPLDHLLDTANRKVQPWSLHGEVVDVPFYDVEGHEVWGATAMMLSEALLVIRDALNEDDPPQG